jgi:BirA family biotin operon repressor/biotin-[acetyl-CoA-carboxylase] ligase
LLHTNEQILNGSVIQVQTVVSTNDEIRRLYQLGEAGHGSVVLTAFQTGGRGQGASIWEAEEGKNLLSSFVFDQDLPEVEFQAYLNMAVCRAVWSTINHWVQFDVSIKWPNDIYVGKRKVAGILLENSIYQQHIKMCIAGIGINVNQEVFNTPNAISIKQATGQTIQLMEVLNELQLNLQTELNILAEKKYELNSERYHEHLMGLTNEVGFMENEKHIDGIFRGVDANGRAIMEVNGELNYYANKSIQWIL